MGLQKRVMVSLPPDLVERFKALGGSRWLAEQLRKTQEGDLISLNHEEASFLASLLMTAPKMRVDLFKKLTEQIFKE